MIATALTFVLGASIAGWILARVKMLLIFAAILAVSNGATGVFFYLKGYNSAVSECKANTLLRERDEARRDLKVASDTATVLKKELAARDGRIAAADKKVQEYATELQRKNDALDTAERKASLARPKSCPACPAPRSCVVD